MTYCTGRRAARWLMLACVLAAPCASSAPAVSRQQAIPSDVEEIRRARNDLNGALAARSVARYARYWTKDAVVMWAGGGLRIGLHDNAIRMARTFEDPHFSGKRTPENIEIDNGSPLYASESGVWVWSEGLKTGGVGTYRGRYLIMWLKTDGQWKIRSELYVETHCSGDPDCK
jgi:ketosteroid isomerase-like protein